MCHVLIIEDEFFISDHLAYVTGTAGATSFDQACTEAEAVRMALRRKPAMILCDIALIEGTGRNAVQAIKEAYAGIPVIFITALPDTCGPCLPPDIILAKPLHDDELASAFRARVPS